MFAIAAIHFSGCIHEDCSSGLVIHGTVLDEVSMQPIVGVPVGGRTITDSLTTFSLEPGVGIITADNGAFELPFVHAFVSCLSTFPSPDQLEIIIIRDGCERRLMVEINDDTAQFIDGGQGLVLELTDPMLVPPCEQAP